MPATFRGEDTGRCPDATLELVADHPGPATDAAFRHRAAAGGLEGAPKVLGANVEAVDVVQQAVVGLADDGE